MKTLLTSVLLVLTATTIGAQTLPPSSSDAYQLGDRRIRIPGPDGFVEISSTFTDVAARLRATEDPGNDFLAAHVPESFIPKLRVSQEIDLAFYTKVSISKKAINLDLSPEFFAAVVSNVVKNSASDANGELIKQVESNSGKGLSELRGTQITVDISGMKKLGVFEKTDRVVSELAAMNVEVYGRKVGILYSTSFVYVNRRLVYVYVYKMEPTAEDVRTMRDFTKNWTSRIVAANK